MVIPVWNAEDSQLPAKTDEYMICGNVRVKQRDAEGWSYHGNTDSLE